MDGPRVGRDMRAIAFSVCSVMAAKAKRTSLITEAEIAKVILRSENLEISTAEARQLARAILRACGSLLLSDDDARELLRSEMEKAGGLVCWAKANEIPVSRVSEFNTGRRPASPTILVALGLCRTIAPLSLLPLSST